MKHTTIRLPDEHHATLTQYAEREGRTVAQEIRLAVRDRVHWIAGQAVRDGKGRGK